MENLKQKCIKKLENTSKRIKDSMPYSTKNGIYYNHSDVENSGWWTDAFWAGIMWQMYKETKGNVYRQYAESIEKKLQIHLYNYEELHHDVGFLWLSTGLENYMQTGNKKSRSDALLAANVLAARFNLGAGVIRAWNGVGTEGVAIIDCMMNIPLLYWASEESKDERFSKIAMCHADKVIKYFIRDDGSVKHIVSFDTDTGEYEDESGGQGCEVGSSWTRGQAWAIYGFVQSYQWTKAERYLDASKKVAKYFADEAEKNAYKIKCDFCQPENIELFDTSAASIAACGFLELYRETKDKAFYDTAYNLLRVCDEQFCIWDYKKSEALVDFGCEMYSVAEHKGIIYGDYYFFKAACLLEELK